MAATASERTKGQQYPIAVVAVAASAGGVEALSAFVSSLPGDFRASVLVVLHIPPAGPSVLPEILARAGKLPARHPADNEPLSPGVIYTAPPDRHLTVSDGRVRLLAGPPENAHRPSADRLMRSVAESFGSHAAGVVLSGTMDDGAVGLAAIRAVGGRALVQDPEEAKCPGMPLAAIDETSPTDVCPVAQMGDRLCAWLDRLADEASQPQELP
jgi:two-component system chemotaxis response regulator CheB